MRLGRILTLALVVICGTAATASAQRNKTTCGADVPLRVSVTGTQGAPNGMAYVSDGAGEYVNGVGRIEARFQVDNCTHDFTLNLNQTVRSMFALLTISGAETVYGSHFFNFDRIHSVPLTTDTAAFDRWCTAGVVRDSSGAVVKNDDGNYQDNYAECGNDDPNDIPDDGVAPNPAYNFARRIASISLDGDERLTFRSTVVNTPSNPREACQVPGETVTCDTDFMKVYHPDADTWIIRSEAPAKAAHFAWTGGKTGYVFQGYQNAPLEITVKRQ
jgi:hypothetical protein